MNRTASEASQMLVYTSRLRYQTGAFQLHLKENGLCIPEWTLPKGLFVGENCLGRGKDGERLTAEMISPGGGPALLPAAGASFLLARCSWDPENAKHQVQHSLLLPWTQPVQALGLDVFTGESKDSKRRGELRSSLLGAPGSGPHRTQL